MLYKPSFDNYLLYWEDVFFQRKEGFYLWNWWFMELNFKLLLDPPVDVINFSGSVPTDVITDRRKRKIAKKARKG